LKGEKIMEKTPAKKTTSKSKLKEKTTAPKKRAAASYLTSVVKTAAKTVRKATSTPKSRAKIDPISVQNRIQQKAYDLFQRRGCLHGYDQFDWAIAEQFVLLETKTLNSSKSSSPKKIALENFDGDVEKRAYELYTLRGCSNGNNEFDWNIAREIVSLENSIPLS